MFCSAWKYDTSSMAKNDFKMWTLDRPTFFWAAKQLKTGIGKANADCTKTKLSIHRLKVSKMDDKFWTPCI